MSKKLTIDDQAFIMASGQYLTENVPDDFNELTDGEFEEWIEEHKWEGVENLDVDEIVSQIRQTADAMVRFRKTTF